MMPRKYDQLTQVELNALQWVTLCERYHLDPKTTLVSTFKPKGSEW